MSTIKSSSEHLTLNADGASKDIKFQANGVEKASISSAGAFTSTTIDATALTGTIPSFTSTGIDDNATSTAIIIDSSENTSLVGKSTNTGYDTYLKIYGNSAPTSNVNRWAGLAVYNNGGNNVNELAFFTGSGDSARTEQAKLSTSGNLTLQGGIKFNGDTATANTLDDYEEGTWTPNPRGTAGSAGAHAHNMTGTYTKIGRQVTVTCYGYITNKGSWTGDAQIQGLPFTSATQSSNGCIGMYPAGEVDAAFRTAHLLQPNTVIQFHKGSWLDSIEQYSDWDTGRYLTITATYWTAT